MDLFGTDTRRAAVFAAYGFGVSLVTYVTIYAITLLLLPEADERLDLTEYLWDVVPPTVAGALAFLLWRLFGPSSTRSRRGLSPAVLGGLVGWLTPILCGALALAALWRGPEASELTDHQGLLWAIVALNPVNWIGLAVGALAGWIYQIRIAPLDHRTHDAPARVPSSRIAAASMLTIASLVNLAIAGYLGFKVLSAAIAYTYGITSVGRLAIGATALLLFLIAPVLSWLMFARHRFAAWLLMVVPALFLAGAIYMAKAMKSAL